MRPVQKITINKDSDFWKSMQKAAELDADKAAEQAAARARKETLERAEQRAAEKKAYLDSIRHYDKLEFKTEILREKIRQHGKHRAELQAQVSAEWSKEENLRKDLQRVCTHDLVLETRTSYRDDYDSWHDGHYERKCIECFLVEKSDEQPGTRRYEYSKDKYRLLEKSQVVLLRKTVDGKEYELEFDDLKW
jgi:hypothetical protein